MLLFGDPHSEVQYLPNALPLGNVRLKRWNLQPRTQVAEAKTAHCTRDKAPTWLSSGLKISHNKQYHTLRNNIYGKIFLLNEPKQGQIINLRVQNHLCTTELLKSGITNTEVIFWRKHFTLLQAVMIFPSPAPRAVLQTAGRRQQSPASGSPRAPPATPGAPCPRNSSQLKNRCVIFPSADRTAMHG